MSGWLDVFAAVVAVSAAVTVLRAGSWRWPLPVAVIVSIAVTLVLRPPPGYVPTWTADLLCMLVEWVAFAISIAVLLYREPARVAAFGSTAAAVAMSLLVLRITGLSSWPAVQACLVWTVSVGPAVGIGLMLRAQARNQARVVAETRRGQRLHLARDLHDFVAHDVSEILATAQAGSVISAADPARAAALFQQIEEAGQRAMSSLDRTVHMLDDTDEDAGPGLADLADLVARFDNAGSMTARLQLDPALVDTVAPAVGAVVYRVVAEGLTNVRRHAPGASVVAVTVGRAHDSELFVIVANDVPPSGGGRSPRLHGGKGIRGLRIFVEAAGGELLTGPQEGAPACPDGHGWHLVARIPLQPRREHRNGGAVDAAGAAS